MTPVLPASPFMTAMFCNCCADGCDCGCVETCGLVRHRERAAMTEGRP
jgi:hypothetical protein